MGGYIPHMTINFFFRNTHCHSFLGEVIGFSVILIVRFIFLSTDFPLALQYR